MATPDFLAAKTFLLANARLLERHRFSFHFENGSGNTVLRALEAYQHPNGLYGYGLEPDKRANAPQPIDQAIAMEVLDAVGAERSAFLVICDALATLSNTDGGLPFSHPSVMEAPHAPWWACPAPQPSSVNPTGMLLSYLWKNSVEHPWMNDAASVCWDALDAISADNSHSIICALAFLDQTPDRDRAARYMPRMKELVRAATSFDPDAEGYTFSPLTFAPSPDSAAAAFFAHDEITPHLRALIRQQEDDGGWPINWPPISDGVHAECRGIVTLSNLRILRDYSIL